MNKAICIHGHFYQPPRENPWLEAVEIQDSAHPFHDWNERITVECYAPNAAARVVDNEGRIVRILNNYARMSFNFGPTLLSWIERHSPNDYMRLVDGDRRSRNLQDGHGNALAQPYNHMIMPLASERDRITQIAWGLYEFERHYGHAAEGMWLPEAAVDLATLDLLVRHDIRFTVLSPHQARRVRPVGKEKWTDVSGGKIDPRRPYLCRLPGGESIALFFYDPHLAHGVAFGDLLSNGDVFVKALKGAFASDRTEAQLTHVATDGESYGHHKTHGDMALAYALAKLEDDPDAVLTNYGRFLAAHSPEWEVEIYENSSWSCAHGLERWRSDCGCKLDTGRNWHQRWRTAMRDAFDWLREQIDPFFEKQAGKLVKNPWAARDAYIAVIADRSPEQLDRFCAEHQRRALKSSARVELLRLFEMQRHGMLMYTSCGWFFDDISGVEAVQNLKHACRVIQLAGELGRSVEQPFLERLAKAESNVAALGDGAEVYRRYVRPAMTDLRRVAAHAAMESAFHGDLEPHDLFAYSIVPRAFERTSAGQTSLTLGRLETHSLLTHASDDVRFAVLRFSGHDVQCSIRAAADFGDPDGMERELVEKFQNSGLSDVVRALDRHFGDHNFTLKDLFIESRRKILLGVVDRNMERYEGVYRSMFHENERLMQFVREADVPVPRCFLSAVEYVLNADLERAVEECLEEDQTVRLADVLGQARRWGVSLRLADAEPRLRHRLNAMLEALAESPTAESARRAAEFAAHLRSLDIDGLFWEAQNVFREIVRRHAADLSGEPGGRDTVEALRALGDALGFVDGGWPNDE
jgi:alpha-amylase/alpha-mannosidase (GH57 family)